MGLSATADGLSFSWRHNTYVSCVQINYANHACKSAIFEHLPGMAGDASIASPALRGNLLNNFYSIVTISGT
jgi:hypothetical protein